MNCPECGSDKFYYVCEVVQYHTIDTIDENGDLELSALAYTADGDGEFPVVLCQSCRLELSPQQMAKYLKDKKEKAP